jgi:DNA-binding PadR family transcriptional regulator
MLYGALKKMADAGLVSETEAPGGFTSGGGRPRHYRLTSLGRRRCAAEAGRLARIVETARSKRLIKPAASGQSRKPRTA